MAKIKSIKEKLEESKSNFQKITGQNNTQKPSVTQTPIPPSPAPQTPPPAPQNNQPIVIRDQDTGKITGVTNPDGKTIMGSDKDIRAILEKKAAIAQTPTGAVEGSTIARQEAARELIAKGGINPEIVAQAQGSGIDVGQAVKAGLSQAVPTAAGFGASALLGSAALNAIPGAGQVASGTITAGAAVIGGVKGFVSGVKSNLAEQRKGQITASSDSLAGGISNLNKLVKGANKNPEGAAKYYDMFWEQLSYIERDYGTLQKDTEGWLVGLTDDGTPQKAAFDRFYTQGERARIIGAMDLALVNPNPNIDLVQPV